MAGGLLEMLESEGITERLTVKHGRTIGVAGGTGLSQFPLR